MPEPRRVQLVSTSPEHCPGKPCRWHGAAPAGVVYVGRSAPDLAASPLANPYKGPGAADRYRTRLLAEPGLLDLADRLIGDADIACWCGPGDDCHGDAILELLAGHREPHDEPGDLA